MAGICLPDEVSLLREMEAEKGPDQEGSQGENQGGKPEERIRMLLASRDDQVPLYVVGQGKTVRKRGERLEVWSYEEGKISEARIREISKVCLYGNAEITTPAMVELMQRNVPVLHFTHGGWFQGIALGMSHKNVQLRIQQFRWAEDEERSLSIARKIVSGKIENCRVLLSRNDKDVPGEVLESMKRLAAQAEGASQMQSLLGFEGAAAEVYFGRFGNMLKSSGEFSFQNRNKRPPKDPVNSVLSYKLSYRRILEVQARLLARVLSGEIKEYPAFVTR